LFLAKASVSSFRLPLRAKKIFIAQTFFFSYGLACYCVQRTAYFDFRRPWSGLRKVVEQWGVEAVPAHARAILAEVETGPSLTGRREGWAGVVSSLDPRRTPVLGGAMSARPLRQAGPARLGDSAAHQSRCHRLPRHHGKKSGRQETALATSARGSCLEARGSRH